MKKILKVLLCGFSMVTAMALSGCLAGMLGADNVHVGDSYDEQDYHKHKYTETVTQTPTC